MTLQIIFHISVKAGIVLTLHTHAWDQDSPWNGKDRHFSLRFQETSFI